MDRENTTTQKAKRKTPITSSGKIRDKATAIYMDIWKHVEKKKDAEWQQVKSKKKKRKPQSKRAKPNMKATEDKATYTAILRKVKADPKLSELE